MSDEAKITAPEGIDQATYEAGHKVYNQVCAACHGKEGIGIPGAFPPLAGSEWVIADDPSTIIRMQLRGLMGPIEVKGKTYNSVMPPSAGQTDESLAAAFTYVRNSWGNSASAVTPAQVKAIKDEGGAGMLQAADLPRPEPPAAKAAPATEGAGDTPAEGDAPAKEGASNSATSGQEGIAAKSYEKLEIVSGGGMTWPITSGIAITIVSLIALAATKGK